MNDSYAKRIELVRNELLLLDKIYVWSCEELEKNDAATQDILHQLELGSYNEGRKYYNKLRKIRKDRRNNKDSVELLHRLHELLKAEYTIKFLRQLDEVLGDTRNKEKIMLNRHYTPKFFTELPIADKVVEKKE